MSLGKFSLFNSVLIVLVSVEGFGGGFGNCTPENSNPASFEFNSACLPGMINAQDYRGGRSTPSYVESQSVVTNTPAAARPPKIPENGASAPAPVVKETDGLIDENTGLVDAGDAQTSSGKVSANTQTRIKEKIGPLTFKAELAEIDAQLAKLSQTLVAISFAPVTPFVSDVVAKYNGGGDGASGARIACDSSTDNALSMCLEDTAPALKAASPVIAMGLGAAKSIASAHDACSKISEVLDVTQKAFTLYQTACTTTMMICSSKCETAVNAGNDFKSKLQLWENQEMVKNYNAFMTQANQVYNFLQTKCNQAKMAQPPDALAMQNCKHAAEAKVNIQTTIPAARAAIIAKLKQIHTNVNNDIAKGAEGNNVAARVASCASNKERIQGAVMGLMSMAMSASTSKNCEKQTGNAAPPDCNKVENKFNIACINKVANMNCNDPINANNQNCICATRPNTPGCPGAITIAGGKSGLDINTGNGNGSRTPSNTGGVPARLDASAPDANVAGDAGSSGAAKSIGGSQGGVGASGGGSGGGGGVSSLNSDQANKAAAGAGYDTSVIGGDFGSGGAAYGGAAYASGADDSHLGSYLPGGKNDPSKVGGAAAAAWAKEVSGPAGKSNWEKVRDRYSDNGYSLITP